MKTKNKSQRARRNLSFIGIFMIMLVLSMPFYSAQALAVSVKITKNTGQAEIPSYLNSAGDVWTVEATVANLETTEVTPEQMQVNVEGSTEYFDSCSSTAGGYLCQYVSDLSSGV
ncbi:hypothetical protein HYX13_05060, partial [Candidatus Woesearchaeota archaeon]|nr:hypothetical protein [Candidatus Woesearchaeota archaeon]